MHLNLLEFHLLFRRTTAYRIFCMLNFGFALPFVSLVDSSKHTEIEMKWVFEQCLFFCVHLLFYLYLGFWFCSYQGNILLNTLKASVVLCLSHSRLFYKFTNAPLNVHLPIGCLMRCFSFILPSRFTQNSLCYNFKRSMSSLNPQTKRKCKY